MKKHLLIFSLLAVFCVAKIQAQTAKWLVQPDFDTISYYSHDIFKCVKNGKIQLIDLSGRRLLDTEADSITDYTEGFALVLDRKGKAYQIKGLFTEDSHDFIPVNGTFYTTFYSHFSESRLVVADERGKQGYLNTWGDIALPCQYKEACPFVHGWASVDSDKDGTGYIDKQGTYMIVDFHYGQLSMGTNFNDKGEALVGYMKNGQGDFAVINTNGKVVRKYNNKKGKPFRDYDAAFSENGAEFTPAANSAPEFSKSVFVCSTKGLFGYQDDTRNTLVPNQFSHAGQVADNCAIVAVARLYGIIAFIDGNFSSNIENADITVQGSKTNEFHYSLSIPTAFDDDAIKVRFDHGDGLLRPISLDRGQYVFKPNVDANASECTLRVEVSMDGLLLWEESIHKKVKRASTVSVSFTAPTKKSEYADDHNNQTVYTTVTNNSDTPVTVSVNYSDPTFNERSRNRVSHRSNQELIINPKEKAQFSLTFNVYESENITLSVTVKANQQNVGTKTSTIVLKPFDLIE